jgi:hypothetical protein
MVNGKVRCDSVAYYSDMQQPAAQLESGHSHGRRDGPNPSTQMHIKSFGECKEVGTISKGDKITTTIYYDFAKRRRDINKNGSPADLMGISM